MDINSIKKFDPSTAKPIDIIQTFENNLNISLCVPSLGSSYSFGVDFARAWFKSKFAPTYFKREFINGKNILHDFMNIDKDTIYKVTKPALAINPRFDFEYNRDTVDLYNYGLNNAINKLGYLDAFFKDKEKHLYISLGVQLLHMTVNFRVKVSSRLHAMDLVRFSTLGFKAGGVDVKEIDTDYHVPTELILRVAQDAGFEIKDNEVVDTNAFIRYLNSHSSLAFMYKYRSAKGIFEYFIRIPKNYIRIQVEPVTMDDGDREGQLENNFIVEFDTDFKFGAPNFYSYYSIQQHDYIKENKPDGTYSIYDLCLCPIPIKNSKGWEQYISTDYMEEPDVFYKKEPATISFADLLKTFSNGRLLEICNYLRSIYINPSIFLDIALYNNNEKYNIIINWENYTISTTVPLKDMTSHIIFYADTNYINDYNMKQYSMKKSKD